MTTAPRLGGTDACRVLAEWIATESQHGVLSANCPLTTTTRFPQSTHRAVLRPAAETEWICTSAPLTPRGRSPSVGREPRCTTAGAARRKVFIMDSIGDLAGSAIIGIGGVINIVLGAVGSGGLAGSLSENVYVPLLGSLAPGFTF